MQGGRKFMYTEMTEREYADMLEEIEGVHREVALGPKDERSEVKLDAANEA